MQEDGGRTGRRSTKVTTESRASTESEITGVDRVRESTASRFDRVPPCSTMRPPGRGSSVHDRGCFDPRLDIAITECVWPGHPLSKPEVKYRNGSFAPHLTTTRFTTGDSSRCRSTFIASSLSWLRRRMHLLVHVRREPRRLENKIPQRVSKEVRTHARTTNAHLALVDRRGWTARHRICATNAARSSQRLPPVSTPEK